MNPWRGCQAGAGTPDLARQCSTRFACERNEVYNRRCGRESQVFDPKADSLSPVDMIPPDDFEDKDDADVRWLEYCRMASTVPRDEVLAVVLDELNSLVSPLFDLIDDALATPHPEPDRPRTNVTDLIKLGQAILGLVAKAVEDAVGLRMAVQVHHG